MILRLILYFITFLAPCFPDNFKINLSFFLFLFQIENRKILTMKIRKTILKSKKVIELLSLSED